MQCNGAQGHFSVEKPSFAKQICYCVSKIHFVTSSGPIVRLVINEPDMFAGILSRNNARNYIKSSFANTVFRLIIGEHTVGTKCQLRIPFRTTVLINTYILYRRSDLWP
ncbi:unnamed protein product [Rotaria sordida]|uniref:Uncharacterized protein n=1 Tax=Rotaria sordida TaxID=392033 RepID=A0A819FPJ4_9BILA|nr:unnamed protein product [Rotaria sordida]CAF3869582.1 unnamed protein product [Rotaria sordida]